MPMTFLIVALGLCAVALGFLLYPFLRDPARVRLRARREVNAEIHRDRLIGSTRWKQNRTGANERL